MGTEKRERQKANKAMGRQEVAQAETRKKTFRIGALVVGGLAVVIALVWVASALTGDDDNDEVEIPTTTTEVTVVTDPEVSVVPEPDTTGG